MSAIFSSRVNRSDPSIINWCRPGLRYGQAPEKRHNNRHSTGLDYIVKCAVDVVTGLYTQKIAAQRHRSLNTRIVRLSSLPAESRQSSLMDVRGRLSANVHDVEVLLEALAHACIAAEQSLSLKPHEGQHHAAMALMQGNFVEMATGEGKTLAIALAAAVIAMTESPVHILTANDYLAERDAQFLKVFYTSLGLTASCVIPTMNEHVRQRAYQCHIVYITAKQAGFDWMRDALIKGPDSSHLVQRLGSLTNVQRATGTTWLQRGLCTAILDEADSLLLDEARTPMILASPLMNGTSAAHEGMVALSLAQMLEVDDDYQLDYKNRQVIVNNNGKQKLERLAKTIPGMWRASRYRDEQVRQALMALHLWQRDRDYVVHGGTVSLIDEQTGRTLPDRRLQHGLHALVEIKEHCQPTVENETMASISFQSFFLRYAQLVGTSATLIEAKSELARVYQSSMVQVPSRKPSQLVELPPRIFATRALQYDALIEEVRTALSLDRPVLVGTRSVEQSRGVSAFLHAHAIQHNVLDAIQDRDEAEIVALAGQAGYVTVATNMAGRGTDIALGEGVAERGGLHLVSLAFNESRRVDRQLMGRTARQGNPGSFSQLSTLDDPELVSALPNSLYSLAKRLLSDEKPSKVATGVVLWLVRIAQYRVEHQHSRQRRYARAARERLARHVALDGNSEHPV